eukprot:7873815-Pyramimonas_sp.AAC.1
MIPHRFSTNVGFSGKSRSIAKNTRNCFVAVVGASWKHVASYFVPYWVILSELGGFPGLSESFSEPSW